jgi:hypothetical protein
MRAALVGAGLIALALGFGLTDAEAAMCGRTCLGGGRYIPGPPEVCAAAGLAYCGPSREREREGRGRRDEKRCTTTRIVRPDGTTITKRSCD